MAEIQLTLTAEEQDYLTQLLTYKRGEARVEERHTDSHEYKDIVMKEEELIQRLLAKLGTGYAVGAIGR